MDLIILEQLENQLKIQIYIIVDMALQCILLP